MKSTFDELKDLIDYIQSVILRLQMSGCEKHLQKRI